MILASDWVAFHADRTPEKLALIGQHSGQQLTYGDLHHRVESLAGFMRWAWKVQPGDVLAIMAKSGVEYFEFQFACVRLGAVMLPLNWRLAEPELLFILKDAGARALVYDGEFAVHVPALATQTPIEYLLRINVPDFPADENLSYEGAINAQVGAVVMNPQTTHDTPMTLMYTAGTTGQPKGVIITHGMTLWNAINITTPAGLNDESRQYSVLPTFHTGGLNLYANPLIHAGGSVVIAREFDPGLTLHTLADPAQAITHFFGVPSIYLFLSQHEDFDTTDLSHIRSWGCGGAPMPVALLNHYARRDIIIQVGFGMTETSPTVFLADKRRALEKPASVGKPLLHTRVRVVNERFEDVPPGEMGEIIISGPNITPGYHNRPQANVESFSMDEYGNRWLHSGDAGTVDEEGCIYVLDRYKDMYISGGENVYPAEVEQVIFQLEGVADVGVIGVPDERWGECGHAIIVLKPSAMLDAAMVIEHCRGNLAKYKVPKWVVFTDSLPRNAAGKVLKRVLKEQFSEVEQSTSQNHQEAKP